MFHACFISTFLCFVHTLEYFYTLSWTNLLTRCHSPSCLFSAVFGSRKSENEYSRNWTGQKPKLLFSRKTHEARRRVGEGPHPPRRGYPQAALGHGVGPLAAQRPCI